jgi:hypothetical protein
MPLALGSQLVGLEPMGEPVRRTVLLVQPSAQAERRVTIPAGAPVLTLWIGLDPLVWDLVRDVTTFQVAVDGEEVFGRALSVEEAWQGWWPAEVDLKRWIGQEVRLTLSTDAGPIGGACGYSAGWGDVQLVGTDAAPYVGLAPADRLRGAWHKAGFTDQDALQALDLAWQSARYDDLWAWRNALETPDEDLPPSLLFRLAISAVITGRELPSPLDPAVLTIHPVGDGVRIQAETLQWLQADPASGLDYGHRLADHPAPTPLEATMGQAGTVVAVVQVSEEADYQLTLRARHKTPEPGSLKLEHNLAPISEFSLTATWQEFTVTRTLTPGLHVIGIQYAQDGGDAILDWVQLEKLTGSLRTLGSQALVATLTKQRIGERLGPTRSD